MSFSNAEAAYQALKFWTKADQFAPLSGEGAFQKKRQLAGQEDASCGGYGSMWASMWAVLCVKYSLPEMEQALLQTGDAFLLEHGDIEGRDKVWSDNLRGDGTNWLGLQLMLLRDRLSGKNDWTHYINRHIDSKTGKPRSGAGRDAWQAVVRNACRALIDALDRSGMLGVELCASPGCVNPTWNGQPNEYCSRCAASRSGPTAQARKALVCTCARPGCNKPSWNGQANEYCSRECAEAHQGIGAQGQLYPDGFVCAKPGCSRPTWNSQPNEHCSQAHKYEDELRRRSGSPSRWAGNAGRPSADRPRSASVGGVRRQAARPVWAFS